MLWRIYLKSKETRASVLANKVDVRDHCVNVFTNNPIRAKLSEGETDESVMKVIIKDLPLSKGIYLGFYVAFNTVQVISRRVVGRAEETSTYSSLGFCTVNCRPTASNYQLSHLRP